MGNKHVIIETCDREQYAFVTGDITVARQRLYDGAAENEIEDCSHDAVMSGGVVGFKEGDYAIELLVATDLDADSDTKPVAPVAHECWRVHPGTPVCFLGVSPEERFTRVTQQGGPKARIEITAWRELFDDEDSLALHVFAPGDKVESLEVISNESATPDDDGRMVFYYDSPESVEHPCTVSNSRVIGDGEEFTTHDGRVFRVNITEVTRG